MYITCYIVRYILLYANVKVLFRPFLFSRYKTSLTVRSNGYPTLPARQSQAPKVSELNIFAVQEYENTGESDD